jgi:hypothetical protein
MSSFVKVNLKKKPGVLQKLENQGLGVRHCKIK